MSHFALSVDIERPQADVFVRTQLGISVVLVPEIVEWDPPRYVKYRIVEGKLVGLDESYLFEPLNNGTRLTITVDSPRYPNNVVGRLWEPLFKRLMMRQVRADFATLKGLLESQASFLPPDVSRLPTGGHE